MLKTTELKLSHNAIENKVYYDLATTCYYSLNKKRKRIDRPEVIGKAKGGAEGPPLPPIEMPSIIKRVTVKLIVYSASVSFNIFAYYSTDNNINVDEQEAWAPLQIKFLSIN